jgi:2-(1,2-epoxy-1,2-dihydrophenyl)acetyl-CoA isomerase
MYLLPRLVGLGRATEMILTGEIVDAEEARRIGLVNRVVAPERLREETLAFARRLAAGPTRAIAAAKAAINRGLGSNLWAELEAAVPVQLSCFATTDFAEGVRALAERRAPGFTGR